MPQTRVAIVHDVPIIELEARVNEQLTTLEAERHNVEILDVRVYGLGDGRLGESGARALAVILYRDLGTAADADAEEQRSTDAFNTMYRDSVH
jgi:hypothetical protein